MPAEALFIDPLVHDAQAMRHAGRDRLSLALMDARNRTLSWLGVFDPAVPADPDTEALDPPLWVIGHAGWFQERWIARHVQRGRGAGADGRGPRLASIDPQADLWFDPQASRRDQRWAMALPADGLRGYLAATLDSTLELLERATDDDDALHVFRLVLAHEDRCGETLAELAQALTLPAGCHQAARSAGLWPDVPSRVRREPLWLPAARWSLGSEPGGWVPEAERWAQATTVPEGEIDAQPVCWAQYAEFMTDGGYDDQRLWCPEGWAWLQAHGRRAPRHVAQVAGGVLLQRQGRLQRVPGAQSVLQVSHHEAQAWCTWAGRRLPTEPEWERAAATAGGRGFVWGDGWEWVAGTARPLDAQAARQALIDVLPGACDGTTAPAGPAWRVLRGGSAFASARLRHAKARRYAAADSDVAYAGFRSCAL